MHRPSRPTCDVFECLVYGKFAIRLSADVEKLFREGELVHLRNEGHLNACYGLMASRVETDIVAERHIYVLCGQCLSQPRLP